MKIEIVQKIKVSLQNETFQLLSNIYYEYNAKSNLYWQQMQKYNNIYTLNKNEQKKRKRLNIQVLTLLSKK